MDLMMKFAIRLKQSTKVYAFVHIKRVGFERLKLFQGWPKSFPVG